MLPLLKKPSLATLIFAGVLFGIGIGLFFYLRKVAASSGSVLVALDAKAAQMDMFLSAAVLASFVLGWLSYGTSAEQYLDYLDPAVVAVLCLLALPIPLKVLWENGREVLLLAPDLTIQRTVIEKIEGALEEFPVADHRIRMLKLGNVMSVTLHIRPRDDYRIESIGDLDQVRLAIEQALPPLDKEIGLDVLFINDMDLAR